MRFVVDNSVSPRFAEALRRQEHEAIHVQDRGLGSADDHTILLAAHSEDRVLVSQDTDFGTILAHQTARSPSVVIFRRRGKSVESLLSVFEANLGTIRLELERGSVIVIEDARIRVRRLPIASNA